MGLFIRLPLHKALWTTNKLSKFNIKSFPFNRLSNKVITNKNEPKNRTFLYSFSYGEFGDMYECRNKSIIVLDLLCVIMEHLKTWKSKQLKSKHGHLICELLRNLMQIKNSSFKVWTFRDIYVSFFDPIMFFTDENCKFFNSIQWFCKNCIKLFSVQFGWFQRSLVS